MDRKKEELIYTDYQDLAVCPWCGYKEIDSWELEDDEYDCGKCGKPFVVVRDVEVTYCTYKPQPNTKQEDI